MHYRNPLKFLVAKTVSRYILSKKIKTTFEIMAGSDFEVSKFERLMLKVWNLAGHKYRWSFLKVYSCRNFVHFLGRALKIIDCWYRTLLKNSLSAYRLLPTPSLHVKMLTCESRVINTHGKNLHYRNSKKCFQHFCVFW